MVVDDDAGGRGLESIASRLAPTGAKYHSVYSPVPDTTILQTPTHTTHRRYTQLIKFTCRLAKPILALTGPHARHPQT
jgi:hypothetical protein